MNTNMPTPFPPNKSAEELGIDLKRKFVVTYPGSGSFDEEVIFVEKYVPDTTVAYFYKLLRHERIMLSWSWLAYADEPETEAYVPQVGDKIAIQVGDKIAIRGEVVQIENGGLIHVKVPEWKNVWVINPERISAFKLLFRPKPKRKVTQAEINERFGEEVEIISE